MQKKTMYLVVMFLDKAEAQKKAMYLAIITVNEPEESALVIKQQLDLERPRPGRPAPSWPPSNSAPNTSPSIQTTEEVEKMETDEWEEGALITKQQLDLERPRQAGPALAAQW